MCGAEPVLTVPVDPVRGHEHRRPALLPHDAVDGDAEIVGPDETDPESLRLLLRDVFTACGGTHDDWDTYDRVMREEGRAAVLVTPRRVYGNG